MCSEAKRQPFNYRRKLKGRREIIPPSPPKKKQSNKTKHGNVNSKDKKELKDKDKLQKYSHWKESERGGGEKPG